LYKVSSFLVAIDGLDKIPFVVEQKLTAGFWRKAVFIGAAIIGDEG
jgi:hypothetical protein